MSAYPGGWFGESWGAPVCDPATHRPTPAGDNCADCAVPIGETDQGMIIPFLSVQQAPALLPYHLECFLRQVVGPGLAERVADDLRGGEVIAW